MSLTGDQKRAYQRKWIKARRDAWLRENGPCAWCDSWENLQIDHKDRYQKTISISQLWSLSPRNPKRISELAKCQVLCFDCHDSKNKLESIQHTTHGNATTYRSGCRCRPCTNAQVLRIMDQRAERKQHDINLSRV